MLRALVAAVAVLELLVPDRIVATGERIALENPGECSLRPWTLPMARLEAFAALTVALRGGPPWRRFRRALAFVGLPLALAPRSALRAGLALAYEDPDCCAVRPWVVPATRALGAVYALVAFGTGRAGDAD